MRSYKFKGKILLQAKKFTIIKAKKDRPDIVMWTNRSKFDYEVDAAIH